MSVRLNLPTVIVTPAATDKEFCRVSLESVDFLHVVEESSGVCVMEAPVIDQHANSRTNGAVYRRYVYEYILYRRAPSFGV